MNEFVNGIEGEVNRRLGVLSLLYNQRRTNSENPKVSLYDLEKRMGWPASIWISPPGIYGASSTS